MQACLSTTWKQSFDPCLWQLPLGAWRPGGRWAVWSPPGQMASHQELPVTQESRVCLASPLWPQNLRRNVGPLRLPVWIGINLSISLHSTGAWYRPWRRVPVSDAAGQESSLILRESCWYWEVFVCSPWIFSYVCCVGLWPSFFAVAPTTLATRAQTVD